MADNYGLYPQYPFSLLFIIASNISQPWGLGELILPPALGLGPVCLKHVCISHCSVHNDEFRGTPHTKPCEGQAKANNVNNASGTWVELLGKWSPVGKYVVVVLGCLRAQFGATIGSQRGREEGEWERERDLNPNLNLIISVPNQVLSKARYTTGLFNYMRQSLLFA